MIFFNRFLLWPMLFMGHFFAMALVAWHLLAQVNFAYPLGYKLLDINQHIQHFGPENRYKKDFAQTTTQEHLDLFAQITRAVQSQGEGLATITYRLSDGTRTELMREAEVIHLQDVANLIDIFYWAGLIGGSSWLFLFGLAYYQKLAFPPAKNILAGFGVSLVVLAVPVLIAGPTSFFYWLHVQIFPDEHEWFFFYQDSLMTTLMKAPDLFGFIAILLMSLFVFLWIISIWCQTQLLRAKITQPELSKSNNEIDRKRKYK